MVVLSNNWIAAPRPVLFLGRVFSGSIFLLGEGGRRQGPTACCSRNHNTMRKFLTLRSWVPLPADVGFSLNLPVWAELV